MSTLLDLKNITTSKSNFGFLIVAIKKLKVCLCPPERFPTKVSSRSLNPFGSYGKIVLDVRGKEKNKLTEKAILQYFTD